MSLVHRALLRLIRGPERSSVGNGTKKIDFETHFPRKLERSEQYIAKVFGRRAEKSFNYAGGAG